MSKRKTKAKMFQEPMRLSFEAFDTPAQTRTPDYAREPSYFNGVIRIERYRVTIEKIEEPVEVLRERLRALYRKDNSHSGISALEAAAKELGFTLDRSEYAIERKPNR